MKTIEISTLFLLLKLIVLYYNKEIFLFKKATINYPKKYSKSATFSVSNV